MLARWFLLMELFITNIGYLYLLFYFAAAYACLRAHTRLSITAFMVLSAFVYAAWTPSLWNSAENLAIFEFAMIAVMFFLLEGKLGNRFIILTFGMLLANSISPLFPSPDLRWWIINALFMCQCIIAIKDSYNTHKLKGSTPHDRNLAAREVSPEFNSRLVSKPR